MCGIGFACVSDCDSNSSDGNGVIHDNSSHKAASNEWLAALRSRGPDHVGSQSVLIQDLACRLHFIASLLQLRGLILGESPGVSAQGHILCFNGEVFGGLDVPDGENDGARLLAALAEANPLSVPEVISRLRGPWALLFWDPSRQLLWFGRDIMGRRSLLVHLPDAEDSRLLFSSVSELPSVKPLVNSSSAAAGYCTADTSSYVEKTTLPGVAPAEVGVACGAAIAEEQSSASAAGALRPPQCRGGRGGGGGGSGSVPSCAEDAGADGEVAEPSGSDGSWTELPPGLYSISFGLYWNLQGASEAPSAVTTETRADMGGDPWLGEEPVLCRRFSLGSYELSMERHAWRDPLLRQLETYRRMESAPGRRDTADACLEEVRPQPQPQPVATVVATALAVAADIHDREKEDEKEHQAFALKADAVKDVVRAFSPGSVAGLEPAVTAVPGCLGPGGATRPHALGSTAAATAAALAVGTGTVTDATPKCRIAEAPGAGSGVSGQLALLAHPIRAPRAATEPPVVELAHALLAALQTAMRVRCACIETRSPHPSAAYAVALTAHTAMATSSGSAATASNVAAAAPPQPSWRRDDPLDFSLETIPIAAAAAAACSDGDGICGDSVDTVAHGASANGSCLATAAGGPVRTSPPVGHHVTTAGQMAYQNAPIMILFSGGVDSVLLAALAHRVLPLDVPIDLCNVCFAGSAAPPSPDREAARDALEELAEVCPGRCWRLVEVNASLEDVDRHRSRILALLRPAHTVMDLNIGAALWLATSGQGTLRLPASPKPPGLTCPSAPSPTPVSSPAPTAGDFYGSAARVVLLGHGADEQCGGYGRHRTRFRSSGWAGLSEELEVDVRRLWLRNLGRDDRLVADWGREARHPFLDEHVMQLLLHARLDRIVDLRLPAGRGDKQVLRIGLALLGLPRAAARVKRAIQFGSRIGKASNTRDFGSNRQANRRNAGGVALQDVKKAAVMAPANSAANVGATATAGTVLVRK